MKKTITSALLMLALVVVTAQASPRDDWPYNQNEKKTTDLKFGFTLGLDITQMHYNSVPETITSGAKNKAGFVVGPTLLFTLPKVGLGFDVSAQFDYRYANLSDVTLRMMSIQVPLNLRYGLDFDDLNVFVFAGPQFNLPVGKKTTDVLGADWVVKDTGYSLNFGLGLLAMDMIQARISYNLSIPQTGSFYYKDEWKGNGKANALQVSVSYFF